LLLLAGPHAVVGRLCALALQHVALCGVVAALLRALQPAWAATQLVRALAAELTPPPPDSAAACALLDVLLGRSAPGQVAAAPLATPLEVATHIASPLLKRLDAPAAPQLGAELLLHVLRDEPAALRPLRKRLGVQLAAAIAHRPGSGGAVWPLHAASLRALEALGAAQRALGCGGASPRLNLQGAEPAAVVARVALELPFLTPVEVEGVAPQLRDAVQCACVPPALLAVARHSAAAQLAAAAVLALAYRAPAVLKHCDALGGEAAAWLQHGDVHAGRCVLGRAVLAFCQLARQALQSDAQGAAGAFALACRVACAVSAEQGAVQALLLRAAQSLAEDGDAEARGCAAAAMRACAATLPAGMRAVVESALEGLEEDEFGEM